MPCIIFIRSIRCLRKNTCKISLIFFRAWDVGQRIYDAMSGMATTTQCNISASCKLRFVCALQVKRPAPRGSCAWNRAAEFVDTMRTRWLERLRYAIGWVVHSSIELMCSMHEASNIWKENNATSRGAHDRWTDRVLILFRQFNYKPFRTNFQCGNFPTLNCLIYLRKYKTKNRISLLPNRITFVPFRC